MMGMGDQGATLTRDLLDWLQRGHQQLTSDLVTLWLRGMNPAFVPGSMGHGHAGPEGSQH